jgi:hypothetical protein
LKEREKEKDNDEERQTEGKENPKQDSELKKTRIRIPGLY